MDKIRMFVKVIQNGSFSRAAEILKIPKSTVSKSISGLERETGTKLILRTTRSLTLTAAGKAFYDSCLGPIQSLEDAQKSLYGQDNILTGLIRITAPEDLGSFVIAPAIGELALKHKAMEFELIYTDKIVDLIKEGFDLAIRIGKLQESGLKVKKIGEITLVLVASPEYLKDRTKIKHPRDLIEHECLTYGPSLRHWSLVSPQESANIKIKARILSNQMSSILNSAVAHGGIALVPYYLCKPLLNQQRLIRVLPTWKSPGLPVSLVSPLSSNSSARLKVTSDYLMEKIQKALQLRD